VFSREKAIHPSKKQNLDFVAGFIDTSFANFLRDNELCAGFLCLWDEALSNVDVVASQKIPIAPFRITKKVSLETFVKGCLKLYSAPHIHGVSDSELWKDITSIVDTAKWQPRAVFIPAFVDEHDFIILAFRDSETKLDITKDTSESAAELIQIASFLLSVNHFRDKLHIMETYVKEIGHDIASSVQAIISKLRNVSRGLLTGRAAIEKISEAEAEIMATYRIADTLGITVDPDYNIGSGNDFRSEDSAKEVIALCLSEAAERHIELRTQFSGDDFQLWGDEKAIQSALMQLLINAIKYAKGSSYVTLLVEDETKYVKFSVTDLGIPLDKEDEPHIWEFGWRGRKAKEMHVNGTGIGLYTVKKIVRAHGGSFGCKTSISRSDVVTFFFRIPKKDILKKEALLRKKWV
jgi:signal transduction histidine kinase